VSRLGDQRGISVVEVVLAATLMIVVLGSSLGVLEALTRAGAQAHRKTATVDHAREAMDGIARALRDATDTAGGTGAVLRAQPNDLVLRAVAPQTAGTATNPLALRTIRYCLGADRAVYRQEHATATAPAAACPDPAWSVNRMASDVVNGSRPLFAYAGAGGEPPSSVRIELRVDADPARPPAATTVTSGVFLRNQNRRPIVSFTATASAGRYVRLNGTASADPEGQRLTFAWRDEGRAISGSGSSVDYVAPAAGARRFTLTVTDPQGASASAEQIVQVLP
jgi:hypothetical protein